MENIRQHRISTNNVYQFLLYFDKLYGQFTDLEKKTFMNSFIERVEIFPERQSDGPHHQAHRIPLPRLHSGRGTHRFELG